MASIFNLSIPQLAHWSRRQLPDHRQLNEPVEALNRMTTGISSPRMKGGLPVAASAIAQFKLKQEADAFPDHLICREWDGVTEGAEDVLVAKPWLLRRTPFDGNIRGDWKYAYEMFVSTERTATHIEDLGVPEERRRIRTEIIAPQYMLDDELIVAHLATDILIESRDGFGQPITLPISRIDITGARGWAVWLEAL